MNMSSTDAPKVFNKRTKKRAIPNPNLKTEADFKNFYLVLVGVDIECSNNITDFLEEFGYLALLKEGVHPKCINAMKSKLDCVNADHLFIFNQSEMDTELLLEEWAEFFDGSSYKSDSYKVVTSFKNGKNIVELQSKLELK